MKAAPCLAKDHANLSVRTRTRTERSGTRTRSLVFEYEYEYHRKRLSTSTNARQIELRISGSFQAAARLIVDAMRDARHMLSTLLKASGYDVQTASDGRTAISVAFDFQPNVILMDIRMPGMSGLEVAKQMRFEPMLKVVILIALTGHGGEADRQQSLEAGFDHHLVKPADIRAIRELLENVR